MLDPLTQAGLDINARARLAADLQIADFRFFEEIDSSQTLARALADAGAPPWTLVVADHQTAGRGQHGRHWLDQPAASLMFSLVLRPRSPEGMTLLPIRAGLAIAHALNARLGTTSDAPRVALKWPNDIIANDRKLGGILAEGQIRGAECAAILGVGINVRPFTLGLEGGNDIPGTFLDAVAGAEVDRLDLLRATIPALREYLSNEDATLSESEMAAYRSLDWLFDRTLREPIEGIARGIDRQGHLMVETERGVITTAVGPARPA